MSPNKTLYWAFTRLKKPIFSSVSVPATHRVKVPTRYFGRALAQASREHFRAYKLWHAISCILRAFLSRTLQTVLLQTIPSYAIIWFCLSANWYKRKAKKHASASCFHNERGSVSVSGYNIKGKKLSWKLRTRLTRIYSKTGLLFSLANSFEKKNAV